MISGTPLSPLDYGAVGNGTTNDTTAITAVIAAAQTNKQWIDGGRKTYLVTAVPTDLYYFKNAVFKIGYVLYPTNDYLNQNTAKVTNAKAYTAWPQDKCYVINNEIRMWANYGDSHVDPDKRAVVFNSDDSGISYQEGEFLDETANGLTSWSAGTDGTYEYVFASTSAVSDSLNGAINAAVTTITLNDAYAFQTSGIVTIDSEQIFYTGKTATTLTGCTRGYNSTTAASHLTAATVSAGILSYMNKRTVPVSPGGNTYAAFTRTLLSLPLPSFTASPAIYQHSFASNGGTIVTGASNGDGAWLLKSTDQGATWTAYTLQASTNAEEPTVKWDSSTSKWYGFIRAGDAGGLIQFFVASSDLSTINRYAIPSGYFNANAMIDSPVPLVIVDGVIHAFCSYRTGTNEGNASDKNVSAFYIRAVIADVVANGNNIWTTSTTQTYYIGNLLHLDTSSSGCGVGSVVSYENKIFLFYGSEELIGTFPATLATGTPINRFVNVYQTVFPTIDKAGFIDYRTKLPEDRSANNPNMRLPGGIGWKAKEGSWVWSQSGQLSASYPNAKASSFGDYIFDLATTAGGVSISTTSTSSTGYSVFNTLGTDPTGWFTDSTGNIRFQVNGVSRVRWSETDLAWRPDTIDNGISLGTAARRWSVVYAGTGTINTSDLKTKQDIEPLNEAEKRVAIAIRGLVKKFRFKDAVAQKGDAARIHVGVIAQEVAQAFEDEGLDAHKYGILCYDEWEADENQPAGNRYGVRYEELLAFIVASM